MSHSTARSERILTLTKDLFAKQDTLPLDTIDGEFFWRICQEPLAQVLEHYTAPPQPERGHFTTPPDFWAARGDYLVESRRVWRAFERTHRGLLDSVPGAVVQYLLRGEHVPMRSPRIGQTSHHPRFPTRQVFVVRVYSGEWTGSHVGATLARELDVDPFLAGDQDTYTEMAATCLGPDATGIHATAFLLKAQPNATDDERWASWDETAAPCIEIVLQFPLPDPDLVTQFYDTSVRAKHGWHQMLPGGEANGQHKEVAIRTWAIGLLMAEGLPYFQAMGEVLDLCGKETVTQGRFAAARTQLLKRVPEARPYLFATR